jgi:hypothetical protein
MLPIILRILLKPRENRLYTEDQNIDKIKMDLIMKVDLLESNLLMTAMEISLLQLKIKTQHATELLNLRKVQKENSSQKISSKTNSAILKMINLV